MCVKMYFVIKILTIYISLHLHEINKNLHSILNYNPEFCFRELNKNFFLSILSIITRSLLFQKKKKNMEKNVYTVLAFLLIYLLS